MKYTFNDVLIEPQFSTIESRSQVSLHSKGLDLPILTANMDTVTESQMSNAMSECGGAGVLHRFMTIDQNVRMFKDTLNSKTPAWVSVGVSNHEFERASALIKAGAQNVVIDVAHGAQMQVANFASRLLELSEHFNLVVGNFAGNQSIVDFIQHVKHDPNRPIGIKIGIGPGAMCTTRVKTGVGVPQLSAIQDAAKLKEDLNVWLIADGGLKTPGDIAKALGAGADMVMVGGMVAGTHETPGELVYINQNTFKKYRGSASKESYEAQNKTGKHRTAEGESTLVPYKGSVSAVMEDIEGGLRSSFTYVGAKNIQEFHKRVKFQMVSSHSHVEGTAHGKVN